MKCSELILRLQECMKVNGGFDFDIIVCTGDGGHYSDVDINCVDDWLYIEGYKQDGDLTPNKQEETK